MTIGVWLLLTAVVLVGVAVQDVLGFGANLLVVPVAAALRPELVPLGATVLNLGLSATVALRGWRSADRRVASGVLLAAVPGAALGVWLAAVVSSTRLGVVASVCVLAAVAIRLAAVPIPRTGGTVAAAGALTGFLGATTSITGPPVALLMMTEAPARSRATVALTGTVVAAGTAVALLGAVDVDLSAIAVDLVLLLPAVVLGVLLGATGASRMSPRLLERLVLVVSTVSAAVVIVRATL